ncbi:MAG TPA: porin, partial [Steroidobacteraceae bacterium]|nr:porin [Steroidobacteraceae bacterium]
MHKFQLRKSILAAMGACATIGISPAIATADNAQDIQQLKDQVRQMQQKIDQLSGPKASTATAPAPAAAKGDSGSLTWNGITLYGTVDIGVEYVSHGAPLSQLWSPGLPSVIQNFSNHSIVSVNGNGLSQSKLGISGVEPIPGLEGWNGVFRLETGFNPWDGRLVDGPGSLAHDNGRPTAAKISAGDSSRAGQAFNGVAFAGVSNKTFGTLTFGRHNGLNLDLLTK